MNRRDFVAITAASTILFGKRCYAGQAQKRVSPVAEPLGLQQIRLLPGPFLDAAQINRRYMMSLDPNRLLHTFRITAGLPSSAAPLGGWEQPENELRGHFTGHYLSGCALMSAGLADEASRRILVA